MIPRFFSSCGFLSFSQRLIGKRNIDNFAVDSEGRGSDSSSSNHIMDFLDYLETDMSIKILRCLDDPSLLVRASAVSRSWRHFVISNGLCKRLCLGMFPQLSRVQHVSEPNVTEAEEKPSEVESSDIMEFKSLEVEHRVYAFLARGCTSFPVRDCIAEAIVASSTDNFPAESIFNTLEPRDRVGGTPSYWSSKGQWNPAVPETLLYKLSGDLCVITEINIHPFQAYFQRGTPIYSAASVRFRMGHHRSPDDNSSESGRPSDKYVWTYVSQEFPMVQENRLQNFKLPEPVLCIGGYLLIELLGRVQQQEMDCLYYICMSHVQVMGRSLEGSFGVEIIQPSDKFVLKALSYTQPPVSDDPEAISREHLRRRVRNLEQLLNFLHRHPVDVVEYEWGESDDDEDAAEQEAEGLL